MRVVMEYEELARLLLAARVHDLWRQSGRALTASCQQLDGLVAAYGRWRVARAFADAGLPVTSEQGVRPKIITTS